MDNKYYTHQNGQKNGPMSAADVLQRYAALAPGQTLNVWSPELKDWKPIGECVDFVRADAGAGPSGRAPGVNSSSGSSSKKPLLWVGVVVAILAAVGGAVVFLKERAVAAEKERAATALQVISGKILIVQKNAEVRKLALVRIDVIRKEDALQWLSTAQPAVDSMVASVRSFIDKSSTNAERLSSESLSLASGFESKASEMGSLSFNLMALEVGMRQARNGGRVTELDEKRDDIRKKITSLAKYLPADFSSQFEAGANQRVYAQALAAQGRGFGALLREAREVAEKPEKDMSTLARSIRAYSTKFDSDIKELMYSPPVSVKRVASATSDGDGLFALKVPPGEYYAIATSSRHVGSTTEQYYWAMKFIVRAEGDNAIMLGNQNLESSDPAVCLWPAVTSNEVAKSCARLESEAASLDDALKEYKKSRPDAVVEKATEEAQVYFNKMKAIL